jgi:two-component system osmolarity sensor histidine kinase EnvZ
MAGRRFDSLFARLMLAQTLLMLLVGLVGWNWLMATRSNVTAQPYAQLWAGALAEVVRLPPGVPVPEASPGYPVLRQARLPPRFKSHNLTLGPGFGRWQAEFAARGLVFDDLRFVSGDSGVQLWFHVVQPGSDAIWLELPSPQIWPFANRSNLLALPAALLLVAMVVVLSGWFARRVTRPLEDLRRRMHGDVLAIDATGRPGAAAASGMARASSEIRAIDHDYQQLLERLRSAELERALLLAGVSHDLRSPLARIRLATELLPQRSAPAPHLAAITRNIDQADRLIGSFLDFVRSGSLTMDETVDVVAVAHAVVARFERVPEVLRMAPGPERVLLHRAHGLLIERLVFNLIDNALKHGALPVVVSVSTTPGNSGKDTVQVDVCDGGFGLPVGQQAAMLKAFARGDPSRGRSGSGLGLSVVQQVVTRLAGTLEFKRDGKGHHVRASFERAA